MDPIELLDEAPRLVAPKAPSALLLDGSRRVWARGDQLFRFAWELHYRDGSTRTQYEREGDTVFQTLFARIPHEGVREILIEDLAPSGFKLRFLVPEGALADILYNCSIEMPSGKRSRIYTFGWSSSDGLAGRYLHLRLGPSGEPQVQVNERRIL
jgi:hypothetical protein